MTHDTSGAPDYSGLCCLRRRRPSVCTHLHTRMPPAPYMRNPHATSAPSRPPCPQQKGCGSQACPYHAPPWLSVWSEHASANTGPCHTASGEHTPQLNPRPRSHPSYQPAPPTPWAARRLPCPPPLLMRAMSMHAGALRLRRRPACDTNALTACPAVSSAAAPCHLSVCRNRRRRLADGGAGLTCTPGMRTCR